MRLRWARPRVSGRPQGGFVQPDRLGGGLGRGRRRGRDAPGEPRKGVVAQRRHAGLPRVVEPWAARRTPLLLHERDRRRLRVAGAAMHLRERVVRGTVLRGERHGLLQGIERHGVVLAPQRDAAKPVPRRRAEVRHRDQLPVQRGGLFVGAGCELDIREAQRHEGRPVWSECPRTIELPRRGRWHCPRRVGEASEVPPVGIVWRKRLRALVGDGGGIELLPGLQQHRQSPDDRGIRRAFLRCAKGRRNAWPRCLREGVRRDAGQRRRIGRRLAGRGVHGCARERRHDQEVPRCHREWVRYPSGLLERKTPQSRNAFVARK